MIDSERRSLSRTLGASIAICVLGVATLLVAGRSGDPDSGPVPTTLAMVEPEGAAFGDRDQFNGRAVGTLPSLTIAHPAEGAAVTSPVMVAAEVTGLAAVQAGQTIDGQVHLHVMVDEPCLGTGMVIPKDTTHLHWGTGAVEMEVELPVGRHTLCVQAGDGFHAAIAVSASITVDVTE